MTSLFYKIVAGYGECRKFSAGGTTGVRIHVEGCGSGFISVGGISREISDGVAHLDISSLPDGEYSPILHKGGEMIRLEPIRKAGDSVSLPPPGRELIRSLSDRIFLLEAGLSETDAMTRRHERAIAGDPLLDYLG